MPVIIWISLSIPVIVTPKSGQLETAILGSWKPLLSDNISILSIKSCYAPLSRQGLNWSITDMHVVIKRFHGWFPTTGLTVSFFSDPRFLWGEIFIPLLMLLKDLYNTSNRFFNSQYPIRYLRFRKRVFISGTLKSIVS